MPPSLAKAVSARPFLVKLVKREAYMGDVINLYDAKTRLSALVDRAAAGEEIIIAKAGKPKAKLVPYRPTVEPRKPAHALGLKFIADDFDAPMPDLESVFEGGDGEA
jgi:prevent-host-death family protein